MKVAASLVNQEDWHLSYCVDSVITYMMAYMNDGASDADRQLLKQLIPSVLNTRKGEDKTTARREHLRARTKMFYRLSGASAPWQEGGGGDGAKILTVRLMRLYDELPETSRTVRFRQYMTVVMELVNL